MRDKLQADGNHVVLVDNGDSIQGEPVGTMTTGALDGEIGEEYANPYGEGRIVAVEAPAD